MSLQNLFTANGLIQAIKDHHKNLHENYNFPPLSGMKSVHKFAESLKLDNAEQLKASLEKNQLQTINQTVHINLCDSTFSEQLVCYFEPEDNTLRVQIYDDADFVIVTVGDDFFKIQPNSYYINSKKLLITYNYVQVLIELDRTTIEVKIIEDINKESLNNFDFCSSKKTTTDVDRQLTNIIFDIEQYSKEVFEYISIVDKEDFNEISSEYIDCAKDNELNSIQAANDWFAENQVRYKLVNIRHGYKDYDVIGHKTLRRLKVPNNVKNGDIINMYYGESTKSGLKWENDIVTSMKNVEFIK